MKLPDAFYLVGIMWLVQLAQTLWPGDFGHFGISTIFILLLTLGRILLIGAHRYALHVELRQATVVLDRTNFR